jgi:hypothetical protein
MKVDQHRCANERRGNGSSSWNSGVRTGIQRLGPVRKEQETEEEEGEGEEEEEEKEKEVS